MKQWGEVETNRCSVNRSQHCGGIQPPLLGAIGELGFCGLTEQREIRVLGDIDHCGLARELSH